MRGGLAGDGLLRGELLFLHLAKRNAGGGQLLAPGFEILGEFRNVLGSLFDRSLPRRLVGFDGFALLGQFRFFIFQPIHLIEQLPTPRSSSGCSRLSDARRSLFWAMLLVSSTLAVLD